MNWRALPLMAFLVGCASSDAASVTGPDTPGTRGVTQGGPQDIAHFRSIVSQGNVPSPDTLDATGFFAEHAFDLPPATCGSTVCLAPMLAVAPRFNAANWTMGFVALSTSVDPATLPRPPMHLVLAIEPPPAADGLARGLTQLLSSLRAEDRVSVVQIGRHAAIALQGVAATDPRIIPTATAPNGFGALYEGLAESAHAIDTLAGFTGAHRVVMVTSGRAESGVTDPARVVALGEALARRGVALSIVGNGTDYRPAIPSALGSLGAGTYAFAESADDLENILRAEGQTQLFPLALDFTLRFTASTGYRVGRIYGARRAAVRGGVAELDAPALFLGQRMGSRDVGGGRRGGGGGLFVELLVDPEASRGIGPDAPAFRVEAAWRNAASGAMEMTSAELRNPLAPGVNPSSMWPTFSDEDRGKVFMMLNMYLALHAAVTFYDNGDCARAQGVIDMMGRSVDGWRRRRTDPDIEADGDLMDHLRENLTTRCRTVRPVEPLDFAGGCMFI